MPLLLVVGLVAFGAGLSQRRVAPQRIAFIQVGQGDCTLIEDGGTTVLIDAAAANEYVNLGYRLAVPELRRLGVSKLDVVLLTHPDSDHIGGLPAVARRFRIGVIGVPAQFRTHESILALQNEIPGQKWEWIEPGASLKFGQTKMEFDYMPIGEDDNSGSLSCLVTMAGSRAVLTGDATEASESWLADRNEWPAELLKAGHHGSRTSTSAKWLREVQPAYAVVSCGRGNSYGHPHPTVMGRLKDNGVRVFRTDRDGTVTFVPTPTGFQPENR